MEIIPAIDLRGGRCVRLIQGDYERETRFEADPVAYARRWKAEGATRLHVVDLDGARLGVPSEENRAVVQEILRSVTLPVQLGGGMRNGEAVRSALAMGVDRAIVGTRIAEDADTAADLFREFGDRLIAAVDARDGRVAVHGWQQITSLDVADFTVHLRELGACRFLFTSIARDGTEEGPDVAALRRVAAAACPRPVLASGGVGTLDDLRLLAREAEPNVEGVVVGKALYVGAIRLGEAIDLLRELASSS